MKKQTNRNESIIDGYPTIALLLGGVGLLVAGVIGISIGEWHTTTGGIGNDLMGVMDVFGAALLLLIGGGILYETINKIKQTKNKKLSKGNWCVIWTIIWLVAVVYPFNTPNRMGYDVLYNGGKYLIITGRDVIAAIMMLLYVVVLILLINRKD